MRNARPLNIIFPSLVRCILLVALVIAVLQCASESSGAQTSLRAPATANEVSLALPEAPSSALSGYTGGESTSMDGTAPYASVPQASRNPFRYIISGRYTGAAISPTDLTVLAGEVAPRQTVRDKIVGSLKDSISPFSLVGETISAGYSHVTNGSPNFGTDAPAFGQRFGASVARGTSQKIFNEAILATTLHEDPRYYQIGRGKPMLKRLIYAGTRPLISRTDSGRATPNFALLGGYLGAAALTKTYYPPLNQGFSQTLQTYGGSLGGSALGYVVSEFLSDIIPFVHLENRNQKTP